jgi:hypothetical protein
VTLGFGGEHSNHSVTQVLRVENFFSDNPSLTGKISYKFIPACEDLFNNEYNNIHFNHVVTYHIKQLKYEIFEIFHKYYPIKTENSIRPYSMNPCIGSCLILTTNKFIFQNNYSLMFYNFYKNIIGLIHGSKIEALTFVHYLDDGLVGDQHLYIIFDDIKPTNDVLDIIQLKR